MRVTSVSLYSNNTEAVTFSLRKPDPNAQYLVHAMTGLDAEEIIPKFYSFGIASKAQYYDFGMRPRVIVMRIVLNPRFFLHEDYSDARDDLYKVISANRAGQVTLHFNSGGTTVARIFGFITKFEVPHFNKLPEVQFTIECNDPMFRAINPVSYVASELSTVNPVIVPDSLSTSPHGFSFQVTFKASAASFTIQDDPTNPDWKFKVTPSGGFLTGDVFYFSSDYASKSLYMVRGGVTTQLMDRIEPGSVWPIVFPGGTTLYFLDIASFNWNNLSYYAAYWGV